MLNSTKTKGLINCINIHELIYEELEFQDISLKDRVITCPGCGTVLDRDVNAASNLVNYYHWYASQLCPSIVHSSSVAASSPETLTACGEDVSLSFSKPTSMNQK